MRKCVLKVLHHFRVCWHLWGCNERMGIDVLLCHCNRRQVESPMCNFGYGNPTKFMEQKHLLKFSLLVAFWVIKIMDGAVTLIQNCVNTVASLPRDRYQSMNVFKVPFANSHEKMFV